MDYALPKILNLDNKFHQTPNTTVFNELMIDKTTEQIIDILCDVSRDKSDTVASCDCGAMTGNYYEGLKCNSCGTICEASLFTAIRNDTWLEIPKSIKCVLHPQVYIILSKWMGKNEKNLTNLVTILNLKEEMSPKLAPYIKGQGFNFFYDNFDAIITYFAFQHPTVHKKKSTPIILKFLKDNAANIWCTKLPTMSKLLQPVTKANDFVRYVDTDIKNLIKSILNLNGVLLSEKMMKFTVDHVERNFFPVYNAFIDYVRSIAANKLAQKPSLLRKHVFGARMHCTARSVAVPIITNHDCDEIYLPWKIGISMYKYHILSILINRNNFKMSDAFDKIEEAMNVYDHDIDIIMQTLIKECPYKGLPILMNRNPSLKIAAIQLLFATRIKPSLKYLPSPVISDHVDMTNVEISGNEMIYPESNEMTENIIRAIEDDTIEVSPVIINGPNLDLTSYWRYIISSMVKLCKRHFTRILVQQNSLSSYRVLSKIQKMTQVPQEAIPE